MPQPKLSSHCLRRPDPSTDKPDGQLGQASVKGRGLSGRLRKCKGGPAIVSVMTAKMGRAARSVLYGAIIITRQFKNLASLYRTWRQPLRGSKVVLIYQALYSPTMPVRRSEILGGNGFDPHWIFALQICLCAAYEEARSRLRSWWDRIFFVNERHHEIP